MEALTLQTLSAGQVLSNAKAPVITSEEATGETPVVSFEAKVSKPMSKNSKIAIGVGIGLIVIASAYFILKSKKIK